MAWEKDTSLLIGIKCSYKQEAEIQVEIQVEIHDCGVFTCSSTMILVHQYCLLIATEN